MKVITHIDKNRLDAGPKAPRDIITILTKHYGAKEETYYSCDSKIKKLDIIFEIIKMKIGKELYIIQYPFTKNKIIMKLISKNNVLLIHDLNSIRTKEDKVFENELKVVNYFKYIIVHNQKMRDYLIQNGINKNKIYVLELFDYICEEKEEKELKKIQENDFKVMYAGNLVKIKSPFIYQLNPQKMKYTINLYGNGIKDSINDKIVYKGAYIPEKLPNVMEGDFGLIWDGNFDESDQDYGFKNYTKYNNPHKLSCYIAKGVPVIVWNKSAVAELVKKYDIGYTIKDLYEINELELKDYYKKMSNCVKIEEKVKNGYFTKTVINKILEDIKNEKINNKKLYI